MYIKSELIKACGKEDRACMADVDEQFFPCHERFRTYWQQYMEAGPGQEDAFLEQYYRGLYSCLVDKDGLPYFEYIPVE